MRVLGIFMHVSSFLLNEMLFFLNKHKDLCAGSYK